MLKVGLVLFFLVFLVKNSEQSLEQDIDDKLNNTDGMDRHLSRRRRYLVFPSGSSLQLVYCLTVPSVGMGQIFTLGHTAALAWELPDKADFILDLKNKKFHRTTTEAPETTTLPQLHLDHDYGHDYDSYAPYDEHMPLERFDISQKYSPGGWKSKYYGINNRKTYYNPFAINKQSVASFGYTPIKTAPNWPKNTASNQSMRRKITYQTRKSSSVAAKHNPNGSNRGNNKKRPITTYIHPVYHQHYRRTRRDLYGKIEKLFTALNKDGKSCLYKAICEVSQVAQRKGSFMEEIIKAIFRIKPHDNYPDEDEYDAAANRKHNCTEQYPTCDGSIWSSMLGF